MTAVHEPSSEGLVVWALPIGTRLAARYRIESKLGEGAMACVYRAFDEVDEQSVALKVLDPLRGTDPVGRARFEQEFSVLSRLSHPGIARSIRTTRHGELDIIVLEYLEGETLQQRLTRGALSVEAARRIGVALAEAVTACHAEGVLHRDLKPANVMLHPDRGPVVLDFGVAWFSAAATLTRTGAVVGSPQYIAPEVLRSSLADPRADIYSLGVVLFEMLTGRPPYGDDHADPLTWRRPSEPPTVFSLRPEVGSDLSRVVAKAMATAPEARFATAAEFAAAIRRPSLSTGRALERRLPCRRCHTARIVDLPFCPGCGLAVEWALVSGEYAVQLDRITDLDRCARWLARRYPDAVTLTTQPALRRRLTYQPVPLAVGVSSVSAEQLASEAREAGAQTSVVHTRALMGPRLRASEASTAEALAALGWHFAVTIGLGLLIRTLYVHPDGLVIILPAVVGLAGLGFVVAYTRRPLLTVQRVRGRKPLATEARTLTPVLNSLQQDRSRHLAAQAFSRAAPVLLSTSAEPELKSEVVRALTIAIEAIGRADAHHGYLLDNPRHDLARALQAGPGTPDDRPTAQRLALQSRKQALTETAVAYDVEVRLALDQCQHMSALAAALVVQER